MKILFLGNNYLGWQVLKWLKETGRDIAGIVIHPEEKQKYADEIIKTAALPEERVFYGAELREKATLDKIKSIGPDVGLSAMFDYILNKPFLDLFPKGCLNLHPGYLPYNKGSFANVWAIVDQTPAGVTLHVIDEGVDTGPVIAQKVVEVDAIDTGEMLYRKLEKAGIALFKESWPEIEAGTVRLQPQDLIQGKVHKRGDVEKLDTIDLDKTYKARDLINILRARTFPPYKGAYFVERNKKIFMEIKLYSENEE